MSNLKDRIPSANWRLLKSLVGKSIIRVKRQIFKSDLNLRNYEQMADGYTELLFNDGQTINIFALTKILNVGITKCQVIANNDSYVIKDVTSNSFWQQRINREIIRIVISKSIYASEIYNSEFGLQIEFQNNTQLIFEYLSEENCLDTIRIISNYNATPYKKIVIQ